MIARAIAVSGQAADGNPGAPMESLETQVAQIFADILEVGEIGSADSFYDFGGTSLQAIRICTRIERETSYRALPIWLFEAEYLADFVKRLTAEGQQTGE